MITLTTDLGYRDPYLAIVKAKLYSGNPNANVIDLSCDLKSYSIGDAAFILKNALAYFPENTVHLVAVKFITNSSLGQTSNIDNTRYLATKYKNQFIITPDNGLFTLIDKAFNEPVYQLFYQSNEQHRFFLKDIFIDASLHLAANKSLSDIASPTQDYYKASQFEAFVSGNMIKAKGIYVDDFGNIITNLEKQFFNDVVGNKQFVIYLPGDKIKTISANYDDVKFGQALALFNSFNNLEIAINGKSAYNMLCPRDIGSKFDFNLMIELYD